MRDILNVASRQVSVEGIQKTVAEYFKIKISDMHSKKRSRNVARPRQVAMALAKELTQMSLPEIGEAFGNRDHTTVLHACRTIASLRKQRHRTQPRLPRARAGAQRMSGSCARTTGQAVGNLAAAGNGAILSTPPHSGSTACPAGSPGR